MLQVLALFKGSSPRVRGAGARVRERAEVDGIIPACAGSSKRVVSVLHKVWDHPRVCGEQDGRTGNCMDLQGSSPRVRGAAALLNFKRIPSGIIPACAGSSTHA